jgi:N-acetylmuramoyl-L-alanine amidase
MNRRAAVLLAVLAAVAASALHAQPRAARARVTPAPSKTAKKRPAAPTPRQSRRTIVVDAGHGGSAPGMRARLANGSWIDEKAITLAIAKKLETELTKRGLKVVMTRESDVDVELEQRGRIANAAGGELFVSIHVNAAGPAERNPRAPRGLEVYFLAEAKTEDEKRVEAMENATVRFETSSPKSSDGPLAFLMNDMAQNEHLRESFELASAIQSVVGAVHPGPNRGVKQANFSVLRNAYMPAVLIETGYGSNPTEATWLASEAGQKELATNIADATMEYLDRYDKRVRSSGQQQR